MGTAAAKTGRPVTAENRRVALPKVEARDLRGMIDALKVAAVTLVPDEYSERQTIKQLLPYLFIMRERGFSFDRIRSILADMGLRLTVGTLRSYFYEFMHEKADECQSTIKKAWNLIDKIESEAVDGITNVAAIEEQAKQWRQQIRGNKNPDLSSRVLGGYLGKQSGGADQDELRSSSSGGIALGREGVADSSSVRKATAPAKHPGTAKKAPIEAEAPPAFSAAVPLDIGGEQGKVPSNGGGKGVALPELEDEVLVPSTASKPSGNTKPAAGLATANDCICLTQALPENGIARKTGVPDIVYTDVRLEHPAISGLMLTLGQRLDKGRLRIRVQGVEREETVKEAVARQNWKAPIATTPSRTAESFVDLREDLIAKRP